MSAIPTGIPGAEREQRELFSHRGDAFSGIGGAREEAVRRRCRVCKGARGGDAEVGDVRQSVEKCSLFCTFIFVEFLRGIWCGLREEFAPEVLCSDARLDDSEPTSRPKYRLVGQQVRVIGFPRVCLSEPVSSPRPRGDTLGSYTSAIGLEIVGVSFPLAEVYATPATLV